MSDILTMICIVGGFGVAFGVLLGISALIVYSPLGEKILSSLTK